MVIMHKKFYASGFLVHLPSQKILLQQQALNPSAPWFLFTGTFTENEEPHEVFKDIAFELLRIKIKLVHPVYTYVNENTGIHQAVMYAELDTLQNFPPKNGSAFAWFSFKDVTKLN